MSDPRNVFPDNVYHTLVCRNDQQVPITLRFPTNSDSVILSNPMMYYALCQKFSLSTRSVPIMTFDNRKETMYFRDIAATPNKLIRCTPASDYGNLIEERYFDPLYIPIYFIEQFESIIKTSLVGTDVDFNYDIGGVFSFSTAQVFPYLALSPQLYALFPNLPARYVKTPEGGLFELVFNAAGECFQESKGLYALNDTSSIILISNNLPIASQGYVNNVDAKQKFKIINQFPIIYDQSSDIDKNDWIFESTEYRPIDFVSSTPFTNFDYEIKLQKKNGEIMDYYLMPGESASMTFRFVKKALFNNEYNLSDESDRIKQNPTYNYNRR